MVRYWVLLALGLLTVMEGHLLQAAGPSDFSGTWTLDLKAPEATSMAAILEARGASMLERKTVDNLSITQVITQTEKTLSIRTGTAFGGRTRVLHLDGSAQIDHTDKTGKVESRTFWDKDGTTLVTVTKSISPDRQKQDRRNSQYTTRRYLKDEGMTLIVDHILTFDDGRKLTARRVLRKQ